MKGLRWAFSLFLLAIIWSTVGCGRSEPEPVPVSEVQRSKVKPPKPRVVEVRPPAAEFQEPAPLVPDVQTNGVNGKLGLLQTATNVFPTLPAPILETPARPKTSSAPRSGGKRSEEVNAIFANPTLFRIEIEIPKTGLNSLRRTGWGNGQRRVEAKVIVRENGVVYTNVALHLKGAAGSFRSIEDKPALTLNFDKFVPGQRFHGLDKLSLNNSVQDGTFLNEKIARELFIAADVPTPRACHALVTLNGRDLGFYVMLEGANKQFLKHYFGNAKGNLFDGGFCQDVSTSLAVNSGDNPSDRSGLRALISTIRQPRPTLAQLEQVLDVDRFISMMVLETILGHWDGYTQNRNNWRVFHDLDAKRMVFVPHGLDQLFGGGGRQMATSLMPPNVQGDVARAVLGSREGVRRYKERAAQIATNVFKADEISARIDEIAVGVAAQLESTHPQVANSFKRGANRLKSKVRQRSEGLVRQFGAPPKSIEFGSDGSFRLTGWKPAVPLAGDPVLTPGKDDQGNFLMKIDAGTNGTSSSSWRTRAVLSPGHYVFVGRIRVIGVEIEQGDTRGGARLRISKGNPVRNLSGTLPWTNYQYEFVVEEEASDTEFICELRAFQGEVWFDAGSLRIIRVR